MSSYFDRWRNELLEDFDRYTDDDISMVIAAYDWESQLARDVMLCTMHPEFPLVWRDMLLSTLNRMAVFAWNRERGDVGKPWSTRDELKQLLLAELEQLDADFLRVSLWCYAHGLPSFNDPGYARFLWEQVANARRAVVGDVRDTSTPLTSADIKPAAPWDPARQLLTGTLHLPPGEIRHWCLHTEIDSWRLSVALAATPAHVWNNRTQQRSYLDFVAWQAWGPLSESLLPDAAPQLITTVLARFAAGAPSGRLVFRELALACLAPAS